MRLLVLSIFTLFVYSGVSAQVEISEDFKYTVSDPYKVMDGWKYYFSKGDEVLSFKYGRGVFVFQKFSGDKLNETKRVDVDKTTGFDVEQVEQINGKIYFFYSVWDKDNETEQLFKREIDFDACDFADEGVNIIKVKGKITGGGFPIMIAGGGLPSMFASGAGKFSILSSFDESRTIIQYRVKPEERDDSKNQDIIGMYVFDENMEEVWSRDVMMPYTEKKMNNVAYTVDGKGNAYVLSEVYLDNTTKRKTKDGDPNYRLEMIKINEGGENVKIKKVEIGDKFVTNIGFFEGKSQEIVVAGYYGNTSDYGTDGCFMTKIDDQGDLIDAVQYEIPLEVMKMYMSDRAQSRIDRKDEKNDVSLTNMVLRSVVFDKDGGLTIYGEEFYYVTTYNPRTNQRTTTYYYQDVLVAHIDGKGELAWMTKLPKNQVGGAPRGGMGIYVVPAGAQDYVLFLDNVNNIGLPINQYPKAHKDGAGGYLTGFKLDRETGATEKVSILDTKNAKGIALYQFNTGRIVKLSNTEFALECYKKKKEDVMLKVTLND